jgi:hypothetical protein
VVCVLFVPEDTEEAFEVGYFTGGNDELWLVGGAVDAHILSDQSDAVKLDSGHYFLTVFAQEHFDSHLQVIRCLIFRPLQADFVRVKEQAILLLHLTKLHSADMYNGSSVDMVGQHHFSPSFPFRNRFTVHSVNH